MHTSLLLSSIFYNKLLNGIYSKLNPKLTQNYNTCTTNKIKIIVLALK
jgi:hypothetical protein